MKPTQQFDFVQNQTQVQKFTLTQGMRQSILMLQLDALDLIDYLKNVSLENPLLEVRTHLAPPAAPGAPAAEQPLGDTHQSLFEYLLTQVQLTMRDTPLRTLVIYLVQQLDPRGYLPLSDTEIQKELGIDAITLADAKTLLQRLDPPGVGAHNLQECLYLQAEQDPDPIPDGVLALLQEHFDDLVAHRYQPIKQALGLDDAGLTACLHYVQTLSADPGLAYNHTPVEFVVPELTVTVRDGKASLKLNRRGQAELIFAQATYDELKATADAEAREYLQAKKEQFRALEYALQRRENTLTTIGREIVRRQFAYFENPQQPLAPLLLRDIAQTLQIAESTVSRAINGKYLQTDFGVFPLKMFFSRYAPAVATEAAHSTDQLIKALKQLVAAEDPKHPLSDEALAKQLAAAHFAVARRTVAKYRKKAGIAPAHARKQL